MYSINLQVLRAKLRGFFAAGCTISQRISKASGAKKHRLWQQKREVGVHARHHLVAYCLLRGIPYAQVEKCATNNQLNVDLLVRLIQEHGGQAWTKEKVVELLSTCPPKAHEKAA